MHLPPVVGNAQPHPRAAPTSTIVGVTAVAVALIAVGGWLAFGQAGARQAQPPTAALPAPTMAAAPAPSPPPAPVPTEVKLTLGSSPAGASIYEGAESIGVTPMVLLHPRAAEPIKLVFKLSGHKEVVHELVPNQDRELVVALTAKSSHSGRGQEASKSGRRRSNNPASDLRDPFK